MTNLQRAWHYWLAEPFTWIFYTFFQTQRFSREFETQYPRFWQRVVPMLRLIIPMFLVGYPLALAGQAVLIPFHLVPPDAFRLLLSAAVGIAVGIALGITGGNIISIALGIALGIPVSIALGIALGIPVSIAGGIVVGIAFGIAFGIALGITASIALGITASIALGITGGIAVIIARIIFGDIALGIVVGIALGIAVSIAYMLGYFRLPLFLASGPSSFRAYRASHQNPPRVFDYLHRSSLYWDERVYLPLPFLKRTLLIAYREAPEKALEEIAFIAAERPQQLRAARAAALEIMMGDLEGRTALEEIAGVAQRLAELLPPETKLTDRRWATPIARLSDACRDATQALSPIGLQG